MSTTRRADDHGPVAPKGTVALGVDIIAAQDIFRLALALDAQAAVLSLWMTASCWRILRPGPSPGRKISGVTGLRSLNATVPLWHDPRGDDTRHRPQPLDRVGRVLQRDVHDAAGRE